MKNITDLKTVRLRDDLNAVVILDQTRLPAEESYLELSSAEEIWDAIYKLKVRGAPAIGVAAAYGIYVCSRQIQAASFDEFYTEFHRIKEYLAGARPTAVNLVASLERMEKVVLDNVSATVSTLVELLHDEAITIREEDAAACRRIGEYALSLLRPGMGILTHCNAGHLAVSEYGTALAPVYLGEERGYGFKVFADETRPLLQGARLTAYELHRAGVDVTLICDNMASSVMQKGWVQAVVVGCDRVAMNGDVANKIGTSGVAVLARHYGIPFYVLGPTSTIDKQCPDGKSIIIEERAPEEVSEMWYTHRMAPDDIHIYNPAFDVTSHELVTAIITEKGIAYPPFEESLKL
ncbi:S-methyl-5-thioribose-1-phosphate isomerase [Parabacteroides sp. TM07-1AC]|jgi:methylthioribose-1-phosphate isomerase|uniref:S-methyl-5-thioribose-1-phosphate isomerase n=1 Tax=unclassified Parabacteroides TaxID=2649774 RepID=UPI000EFE270A|nr:S-methyl-5-thioribose-1-phosphate isomerase [Parabacteroides sp. TM07-1AC]RHU25331.1 S-methyl-5-thioribose-1-phosphate isomerase [Parabacteroides sp. TM07-1AC]